MEAMVKERARTVEKVLFILWDFVKVAMKVFMNLLTAMTTKILKGLGNPKPFLYIDIIQNYICGNVNKFTNNILLRLRIRLNSR